MKKSIVLCILLILLLLRPDCTTEGARYGLLLWYNSVVPALFPFMVLSNLIVHTGRPLWCIADEEAGEQEEW